jgi:hypothetical protein
MAYERDTAGQLSRRPEDMALSDERVRVQGISLNVSAELDEAVADLATVSGVVDSADGLGMGMDASAVSSLKTRVDTAVASLNDVVLALALLSA